MRLSQIARTALALAALMVPVWAHSQTWQLQVGAQSSDKARQAFAFLPNEIWIHVGDTITWTSASDELHTVTFLKPGQVRPSFQIGCPGVTPDGSPESGATCVNSGVLTIGNTYMVTFPIAGNFKLVCLVHSMMTATVHVLDLATPLPHDQAFYDHQSARESATLFSDVMAAAHNVSGANAISAGSAKVIATGGGSQTASVVRFIGGPTVIHAGETVEWTNSDGVANHTITFGPEPANLPPPSVNVFLDADGARHVILSSPSDVAHSGFISPAPQDRAGLPQSPLSVTRFRVTFTGPGVYRYICSLHDDLGMVGEITVVP